MSGRISGLYMRVDGFKSAASRTSQKKRSVKLFSRFRILLMAKRFNIGLFFMILVAVNFKMCMPDVESRCILCMTGETAETQGVVTKVEVSSYGVKGYNEYDVYYTYTVEGKSYTGMAADEGKGLTYLENHAVVVDYSVKNHACSCVRDMTCLAQNGLFAATTGAILLVIAIIFMLMGIRGVSRAVAVLEYGEIVTGTVTGISEEKKSNLLNFGGPAAIHRNITLHKITCSFTTLSGKNKKFHFYARSEDTIKRDANVTVIYDPDAPENAIVTEALSKYINTSPELAL